MVSTAALAAMAWSSTAIGVGAEPVTVTDVQSAALSEQWTSVTKSLDSVGPDAKQSANPVLRLIKGHACLALNRNNESLGLLLSVSSPEDLAACEKWVNGLVAGHKAKAMSHYFQGDILARRKKWPEAIAAYSEALKLHTNADHPLIHNARGVAYAQQNEVRLARTDFDTATKSSAVRLADAYANIGSLAIQRKGGAAGAVRAFDQALAITPDFALALYGRACATLVYVESKEQTMEARTKKAAEFLERATKHAGEAAPLLREAQIDFLAAHQGLEREELSRILEGKDPGMNLQASFNNMLHTFNTKGVIRAGDYNKFVEAYRRASGPAQVAINGQILKQGVPFNQAINGRADKGVRHTEHSSHTLQSWSIGVGIPLGRPAGGLVGGPPGAKPLKGPGVYVDATFGGYAGVNKGNQKIHEAMRDLTAGKLMKQGGLQMADGVVASLKDALWDDGDWPFKPLYGLAYGYDRNTALR